MGRSPFLGQCNWRGDPTVHSRKYHLLKSLARDEQGIFRVIYVAKFADAVYVLHCFQKKTQKTSRAELDLASRRYKELVKEQSR